MVITKKITLKNYGNVSERSKILSFQSMGRQLKHKGRSFVKEMLLKLNVKDEKNVIEVGLVGKRKGR